MTAAPDSRLGTNQLWLLDVSRGSETRFYSHPRPSLAGAWAPGDRGIRDGVWIADEPSLRRVDLLSEKRTLPREHDVPGIDPGGVRGDRRQRSGDPPGSVSFSSPDPSFRIAR
jgi:hypothetical protein